MEGGGGVCPARRVVTAKANGAVLPAGVAVDAQGAPTTDPAAALAGALLTFGGHKVRRYLFNVAYSLLGCLEKICVNSHGRVVGARGVSLVPEPGVGRDVRGLRGGGSQGSGLSLIVELLGGVLPGGAYPGGPTTKRAAKNWANTVRRRRRRRRRRGQRRVETCAWVPVGFCSAIPAPVCGLQHGESIASVHIPN